MKIVLVRHGQPDFNTRVWVGGLGVREALLKYSDSRVTAGPAVQLIPADKISSTCFMSSELPRAKDSLKLCCSVQTDVTGLLNEAELPHPNRLFIPLPWSFLVVVCRLSWLFGYRSNAPGFRQDKVQAEKAAVLLIERAAECESVYAFGHGIMNRLIARELKKHDWKIHTKSGSGYWGSTTLTFTSA